MIVGTVRRARVDRGRQGGQALSGQTLRERAGASSSRGSWNGTPAGQRADATVVEVDSDHLVVEVRKAGGVGGTPVPGAQDGDPHPRYVPESGRPARRRLSIEA